MTEHTNIQVTGSTCYNWTCKVCKTVNDYDLNDEKVAIIAQQDAEIKQLKAIVDWWPRTADNVPAKPNMHVWYIHPGSGKICSRSYIPKVEDSCSHHIGYCSTKWITIRDCYSTLEAAIEAKEKRTA